VPSLDLRFSDNKSLVDATTGASLVTFTRASSGTFVGSDGVIRSAVTNLLLRSEEFDTTWVGTRLSAFGSGSIANAIAAPNGTITADKIAEDTTASNTHFIAQTVVVTAGIPYAFSVYVKAAERTWAYVLTGGTPFGSNGVYIDLSNGSLGSTVGTLDSGPFVQAVGDGWYRVSFTATPSTGGNGQLQVRLATGNDGQTYTGNGTSGIFLWGAQLEQASTVGEYIPTTSAINSAPRFDHNPTTGESLGLLVEEARTNNLVQSEDFATTWTLSTVTVSTNTVTAPDGTLTADTFGPVVGDGLTTTRFLRQNPVLTTQQAYTFSVFVKVGTATTNGIALYISDSLATVNFRASFNLFTQTTSASGSTWATPTATIVPYPNGWYRCILSGVTSTVHTGLRANIYLNTFGNTSDTYGTHHIWGAQLEAGAFPTSYIPTTTATVTRAADVASITGANFSGWYNHSEGTMAVAASMRGGNTVISSGLAIVNSIAKLAEATATVNGRSFTFNASVSPNRYAYSQRSSLSSISIFDSAYEAIQFGKHYTLGGSYVNNSTQGVALSVDGRTVFTNLTAVDVPVPARLLIGAGNTGSNTGVGIDEYYLNGTIKRLTYWPTRLANTTLQQITQP
jgi:hypothetical protein